MSETKTLLKVTDLVKESNESSGARFRLLENISFTVQQGEIVTILAPPKAGKSTLLKLICGIEKPDSGTVQFIQSDPLNYNPNAIYLPSEPSSLPWLSVRGNIELMLKLRGTYTREASSKALDYAKLVGLDGYDDHIPHNSSIGFRFRISLASALAAMPKSLLIDEPLNLVSHRGRDEIYNMICRLKEQTGITIIWACSGVKEALILSDRILVMGKNPGRILKEFSVAASGTRREMLPESDRYAALRKEISQIYEMS
ncbi:MAG: ABC transporter ATP-binding protein [Ignavibacteriales bacterium]